MMAPLPHGPEWSCELIERYHTAIAGTAAEATPAISIQRNGDFISLFIDGISQLPHEELLVVRHGLLADPELRRCVFVGQTSDQ